MSLVYETLLGLSSGTFDTINVSQLNVTNENVITSTITNLAVQNITGAFIYASTNVSSPLITSSNIYTTTITASTVTASGQITALSFNATSDYRVKNNVQQISDDFTIKNLRPVYYDNTLSKRREMGFIAHEVQEQFPFLVSGEKDGVGMQSLNYTGLIPLLVKEIQDLKAEVAFIKQQIKKQL